ncbi:ROK family protein [Myxococcaceae bacterium GXIMD 01537]
MADRAQSHILGGVDLGGTKIQAVVVDERGTVLSRSRRATPQQGGPPAIAEAIFTAIQDATRPLGLEPAALAGMGVGAPGAVNAATGTLIQAGNLPGWDEPYPLGPVLSERVQTPVFLGNDVQVAVDAEYRLGAGRAYRSLLGVWWGTGVGGGLILDGRPWLGRGSAGEIGHTVVERGGARCPCGRRGCLEAYAGRASLERKARRAADRGKKTVLFDIMREQGKDRLTSGVWLRALQREDALARKLVERALRALGAGLASAVNLLDVEAIVIGGGLGSRLGLPYVERLISAMHPHLFIPQRPPAVHLAGLGELSGAIGAALLARTAAEHAAPQPA